MQALLFAETTTENFCPAQEGGPVIFVPQITCETTETAGGGTAETETITIGASTTDKPPLHNSSFTFITEKEAQEREEARDKFAGWTFKPKKMP